MNLPTLKNVKKTIKFLNSIDFKNVSYLKLTEYIKESFMTIPIGSAMIKPGYFIERGRINPPDTTFMSEKDISYRNDYYNIQKFGRANSLFMSMFYGSVSSNLIQEARLTNLLESWDIINAEDKSGEIIITVGKWEIKEQFEVAEICFNELSLKNNPDLNISFENHLKLIVEKAPQQKKQIELIFKFFSDEFAKSNITSHFDYMISAYYTSLVVQKGLHGVIYPSVKSEYKSKNIALTPYAVEKYLELKIVGMFKISKKGKKLIMHNLYIAQKLGALNSSFKWEKTDQLTPNQIEHIFSKM